MRTRFRFLKVILCWLALLVFPFISFTNAFETKTLNICVFVDEEFRSFKNWKETIFERFESINSFYKENIGLVFNVNEFSYLSSKNNILVTNEMFADLKDSVKFVGSEISVIYIG